MKIVRITCPECGEEVIFSNEKKRKQIYCTYCRSKLKINYNENIEDFQEESNSMDLMPEKKEEKHILKELKAPKLNMPKVSIPQVTFPAIHLPDLNYNNFLNTVIFGVSVAIVSVLIYIIILLNKPL